MPCPEIPIRDSTRCQYADWLLFRMCRCPGRRILFDGYRNDAFGIDELTIATSGTLGRNGCGGPTLGRLTNYFQVDATFTLPSGYRRNHGGDHFTQISVGCNCLF